MVYLYLDPLFSLLIVHAPVVTDNVPVVDAACSISISAYVTTSNSNYTVTYRAYAVKKSNGAKVYGTTKTKRYK